jgi:hypothetical protein
MGVLVGGYRFFIPLSNIWVTILAVVFGGMTYGLLILKFDKKVYTEMRDIVEKIGIGFVWPGWL